jgi:hypothetical protein
MSNTAGKALDALFNYREQHFLSSPLYPTKYINNTRENCDKLTK